MSATVVRELYNSPNGERRTPRHPLWGGNWKRIGLGSVAIVVKGTKPAPRNGRWRVIPGGLPHRPFAFAVVRTSDWACYQRSSLVTRLHLTLRSCCADFFFTASSPRAT